MSSVLVYGDTSANIIDGSSVWLVSISRVLSELFDEVHLQLKFPVSSDTLLGPLREIPGILIHEPVDHEVDHRGEPTYPSVARHGAGIARDHQVDVVIVRGLEACVAFSSHPGVATRLWSYVTDLPFPVSRLSATGQNRLNRLAHRSVRMFAQTEAARAYLEAIAPSAAGKTVLMPPMIPPDAFTHEHAREQSGVLKLIYAGKFAREWQTREMLDLPRLLAARGVRATLTVVGAKFNNNAADPNWPKRMQRALQDSAADPDSGVLWVGSVPRSESLRLMSESDVGLGWRRPELDSSLEISTKVLEYGATGAAPLMNDTLDHRDLYSESYPLMARGDGNVESVADLIASRVDDLALARTMARQVSERYSMQRAVERLRAALAARGVTRTGTSGASGSASVAPRQPTKVLVAGHEFKFMGEVLDGLRAHRDIDLSFDHWTSLREHDEPQSLRRLADAETIVCEWAGPNLVWYSQRKQPHQRLIARMHGFEMRGARWVKEINFDAVDTLIVVSEHYRAKALASLRISEDRVVVIPNSVDVDDLARPKHANSQFRLGLVGWVPFLKRPDRAVDLIEALRRQDSRYVLHVRGRPPWEYPHHWNNPVERRLYYDFFAGIRAKSLQGAVAFENFGPDMGSWLRKIGVVLSPSDHESFHLAPAEGMASGAVPVIWGREGAREVFGDHYVYATVDDMVTKVLALADPELWLAESAKARDQARTLWSAHHVNEQWFEVMGLSAASTTVPPRPDALLERA